MKLIFMRHAEAQRKHECDSELDDFKRVLIPEGIVHAKEMVLTCAFLWKNTECIFTSSYPRAVQTAQIIHRQFPGSHLEMTTALDKFSDGKSMLRLIRNLPDGSYTFVGHDPLLSQIISRLVANSTSPIVHLPKAGIVVLEGKSVEEVKIRTVLTPKIVMRF